MLRRILHTVVAVAALAVVVGTSPAALAARCPDTQRGPALPPGTQAQHLTLDYWLARVGQDHDLDAFLMDPVQVEAHRTAIAVEALGHHDVDPRTFDRGAAQDKLDERLAYFREVLDQGKLVVESGARVDAELVNRLQPERLDSAPPELLVARGAIPVRCAPWAEGLYSPPVDTTFDRNNCSTLRPGDGVQVLMGWAGGMLLVRARYTWGWIPADAPLSAPVTTPPTPATAGAITRRAILERAFARVGDPYGWGGEGGGLDCSRFLMDVFGELGLELPRSSRDQARAGTFSIDISDVATDRDRMSLVDAAAERGLVLLYFPGHIMLYLGRDADGTPMAIHSFAEYLAPCDGGGETRFTQHGVTVSNLELGRGSSRTAFVERLTRLVVIGGPPGVALQGAAQLRAAAPVAFPEGEACDNTQRHTMIRFSPRRPNAAQPLRVIVTSYDELAPGELAVVTPGGTRLTPELKRIGGPPWAYVATIDAPEVGTWQAAFGDGARTRACTSFDVVRRATFRRRCRDAETLDAPDPTWRPRRAWGPRTEALYAAFVEALFDHPPDEDLTWHSLQPLLEDPERNILFNHFGRNEDARLHLRPDCADLPYFLRAYFAWKLELPFAFRQCGRGRPGEPPGCMSPMSQGLACDGRDDIEAFDRFLRRQVGGAVHSGHGRTAPGYDVSDYYPVPLTRDAIRPGTIFADPFGHVMIVVRWVDQTATEQGVLIAADAQPDGTIGRRRFWRGSFLFTPEIHTVGSGFKAFRPARYKRTDQALTLGNRWLVDTDSFPPWSAEQYAGTADDFYDQMAALTNPRPLDPFAMQVTLVDAFEEQLARRVVSVDNGEAFKQGGAGVIPMPNGLEIFQTSGPWESFSTPSRDMRLLIAMDTVLRFPDRVRKHPERFGVQASAADELAATLTSELSSRSIAYTRSDGSAWTLTLEEVAARAGAFEMAYNPNDCVELRWAAPPDSPEASTCAAHAPASQRKKMLAYRDWFRTRTRPQR